VDARQFNQAIQQGIMVQKIFPQAPTKMNCRRIGP
jgi:hypothetical protein